MWSALELGPVTCSGGLPCVGAGVDGIGELGSSEATEGEAMSCADAFDVLDDAAALFHARLRLESLYASSLSSSRPVPLKHAKPNARIH